MDEKRYGKFPWRVAHLDPLCAQDNRLLVVDADGDAVAVARDVALDLHHGWWGLRGVDAHLIAAAPDLLGFLERLVQNNFTTQGEIDQLWMDIRNKLEYLRGLMPEVGAGED